MDSSPESGQGATEFLLAAVPLLLVGLGSIEALHWYFVRQALSLALEQAARSAIVHHADPVRLDAAFSKALLGLYAGTTEQDSHRRLNQAITRRERALAMPAWRLRILSPSRASFSDFRSSDPGVAHDGYDSIDNDHLDLQHHRALERGWPEGRGPESGQTILDANTLVVHLTWLHEPLLPGVRQLLRQIAPDDARYGATAMARAGYLPIQREIRLVMQSHPVDWPMPSHGRVHRIAHPAVHDERLEARELAASGSHSWDPPPFPGLIENGTGKPETGSPETACTGLWCLRPLQAGDQHSKTDAELGRGPGDAPRGESDGHVMHEPAPTDSERLPGAHTPVENSEEHKETGIPPEKGQGYPGEEEDPDGLLPDADACPDCCDP